MKSVVNFSFLVLFLSGFVLFAKGATHNVIKSGKWNHKSTWNNNSVPACGDTIEIGKGFHVEVDANIDLANCNSNVIINVGGVLSFKKGNSLNLGCNSVVSVLSGGLIEQVKSDKFGTIKICNSIILFATSGTTLGPVVLQVKKQPVEVLHFTAKPDGDDMLLTWATVEQVNNKSFIIDKGKNGTDFDELARVTGAGSSKNIHSYKMIDKNPFAGKQYYRLRQLNIDGSYYTHKIIAIDYNFQNAFKIYPNPTFGELYANINPEMAGEPGQLVVNNTNGKHVLTKDIVAIPETNGIQLLGTSEALPKGDYLVTLNFKKKTFTQYIICK